MNVTSGIVKNRSKQAPWLRESYDHGWKEEWKRLPCNNCRGSFWVYDRLACRLQSLHRTVASRSHTWKLLIFLLLHISGVLDRFTTCAGRFSQAARLMPWLMKLDHRTLGASPGTTSVNDFFRKRDRLKGSRARTSI
jgi:hypothetical protein